MELVKSRDAVKTGMPQEGLFVLVGDPKSGKTSLAAGAPGAYVLELEPGGADRVAGRIHEVANLADFREALKLAVTTVGIKSIVIDTLDMLSDWIEDEIAHAVGMSNITDRKKGVDGFEVWGEYRRKMEGLVGYLKASGKLCILIAHCKEPKLDANGLYATPKGMNIPGKTGPFIAGQADLIGYTFKRLVGAANEYCVTFQGGPLGIWGSRVDELNDKTLVVPKVGPWNALLSVFGPESRVQTPAAPPAAKSNKKAAATAA